MHLHIHNAGLSLVSNLKAIHSGIPPPNSDEWPAVGDDDEHAQLIWNEFTRPFKNCLGSHMVPSQFNWTKLNSCGLERFRMHSNGAHGFICAQSSSHEPNRVRTIYRDRQGDALYLAPGFECVERIGS